jgi:hypothetical protein
VFGNLILGRTKTLKIKRKNMNWTLKKLKYSAFQNTLLIKGEIHATLRILLGK